MTNFVYPVRLSHDEDGRVLVEFPDFPFAVTDGADVSEALTQASDCLEEALAFYITEGEPIPEPTRFRRGAGGWIATVAPGPVIAAKAALYQAVRDAGITKVALAAGASGRRSRAPGASAASSAAPPDTGAPSAPG